jgi:hypothetical protein
MKYIPTILIFASFALLTTCKKDDPKPCQSCVFVIANGEPYPYSVSFLGTVIAPFTLKTGELKSITMPTGVDITVKGDYQSPFAHNDFSMSYQCPGDCGAVSVVLKE